MEETINQNRIKEEMGKHNLSRNGLSKASGPVKVYSLLYLIRGTDNPTLWTMISIASALDLSQVQICV
ncbi:MAG: helix-turn-helix transcriptional regulator [Lachnospiraceae bacterium]|nr:helix-turn-helix transcriptional regulator [Lachnospiraceae bacterium]